jgi:hypothetical protein
MAATVADVMVAEAVRFSGAWAGCDIRRRR